jgi:hypothetical protein
VGSHLREEHKTSVQGDSSTSVREKEGSYVKSEAAAHVAGLPS